MASRYDDELWELVPDGREPAADIVRWVGGIDPAENALDLGCGDGRVATALRAKELTLADVSLVALERARALHPKASVVELDPDQPLPLPDNEFDLVLCADVIEHVRDVQLLLSEARRVLRPRGHLAMATPAHKRRIQTPEPLSPHLRFFTERSLGDLVVQMGFDMASLESRGGVLFVLASR